MPELELQLQMDTMQHMLHSHFVLRVWRAHSMDMVAELPMPLVVTIIGLWLAQTNAVAATLAVQAPPRKALASAPPRSPLRAVGVPLRPVQEARRAARALRKGRGRGKGA